MNLRAKSGHGAGLAFAQGNTDEQSQTQVHGSLQDIDTPNRIIFVSSMKGSLIRNSRKFCQGRGARNRRNQLPIYDRPKVVRGRAMTLDRCTGARLRLHGSPRGDYRLLLRAAVVAQRREPKSGLSITISNSVSLGAEYEFKGQRRSRA